MAPSGVNPGVVGVVLLLFLITVAPCLTVPIVYLAAALVPSAILLSSHSGHAAPPGDSTAHHQQQKARVGGYAEAEAGGGQPSAAVRSTSSGKAAAVSTTSHARGSPEAQPDVADVATWAPHSCAGCSTSSCPWHLPPALSLSTWGSGNGRRSSSGSKRPSSTSADHATTSQDPEHDLPFSFGSSAPRPAAAGLVRCLSAPPAGQAPAAAGGDGPAGGGAAPDRQSAAAAAAVAVAAGVVGWEQLPSISLSMVQLGNHSSVQQPARCSADSGALVPDSPRPVWRCTAATAEATARGTDLAPACTSSTVSGPLQPASPAAAAAPAAAEHAGKPMVSQPGGLQAQQPQLLQQDSQGEQPSTPQAQLAPELLDVFKQIWQDDHHPQDCAGGQQLQHPECIGGQLDAACSRLQPGLHTSPLTQHPVFAGPPTPLLFVATTNRHSGCLRQPSTSSPRSSSCAGSGFAGGAPPLPSPAQSPLARRLSARDCSGLPAASPALKQLIYSGGSSRQQLRRGGSLDSRRAASTPGSARGSLELQVHEQQQAPWAGFPLRPVSQRQQQLQQQLQDADEEEGVAAADAGTPWYRRLQLERRHTFANTLELSVAADGAVADVDGAVGAAAAPGALAACGTSSNVPLRRHLMGPFSSQAGGTGVEGPAQCLVAQPSAVSTGPPCAAAAGGLTPHRLSCSSSATDSHLESEGSGAADAAAAVVLTTAAGSDGKPQQQDVVALGWV